MRLSTRKSLTCPFMPEYGPGTPINCGTQDPDAHQAAAIFRQVRCQRTDRHSRIDRLAAREAALYPFVRESRGDEWDLF